MKLIIVESPVKTHTITKFLQQLGVAKDFHVVATAGHILDLDPNSYSVYRNKNGEFTANAIPIKGKTKIINELKELTQNAKEIYMCQDDDREGEKISHDIVEVCKIKKYFRVVLLSINLNEVKRAFIEKYNVRLIDEKVVLAQQTRRIIDRIIGYGLSPALAYYFSKNKILSYKNNGKDVYVKPNGTGRVIGIALSILAKRQKEIEKYKEHGEYITDVVVARYTYEGISFDAKGEKLEFLKKDSELLNKTINNANMTTHKVYDYKPEIKDIPPYPPFTTATLYSACSYIFDIPPHETKKVLQDLYETGYITYPRTDNYNICNEASEEIITYLLTTFHENSHDDILKTKRKYKKKKSSFAQEAHEAIRPIYFTEKHEPKNIQKIWKDDKNCNNFGNYHKFVYELIWDRTISTQLVDSIYDVSKVTISAGEYTFTANARNRITNGWEDYYGDILHASDKGKGDEDWINKRIVLPTNLYVGLVLENRTVESYEKHSRSPKRISEGALISQLVSNGVARPSTLHTISQTIKKKKYATSNRTLLTPTELGLAVFNVVEENLSWLNNIEDAQNFEKVIEEIEAGNIDDVNMVIELYWEKIENFKKQINYVELENRKPSEEQIDFAENLISKMDETELTQIDKEKIFSSQKEMSEFLSKESNKRKKDIKENIIGACPKCGRNSIIQNKNGYTCFNKQCDFMLWEKSIDGFMDNFKVKIEKIEFVKMLIGKKAAELDMESPRTKNAFKGKVKLSYNKEYKNWGISFV